MSSSYILPGVIIGVGLLILSRNINVIPNENPTTSSKNVTMKIGTPRKTGTMKNIKIPDVGVFKSKTMKKGPPSKTGTMKNIIRKITGWGVFKKGVVEDGGSAVEDGGSAGSAVEDGGSANDDNSVWDGDYDDNSVWDGDSDDFNSVGAVYGDDVDHDEGLLSGATKTLGKLFRWARRDAPAPAPAPADETDVKHHHFSNTDNKAGEAGDQIELVDRADVKHHHHLYYTDPKAGEPGDQIELVDARYHPADVSSRDDSELATRGAAVYGARASVPVVATLDTAERPGTVVHKSWWSRFRLWRHPVAPMEDDPMEDDTADASPAPVARLAPVADRPALPPVDDRPAAPRKRHRHEDDGL